MGLLQEKEAMLAEKEGRIVYLCRELEERDKELAESLSIAIKNEQDYLSAKTKLASKETELTSKQSEAEHQQLTILEQEAKIEDLANKLEDMSRQALDKDR